MFAKLVIWGHRCAHIYIYYFISNVDTVHILLVLNWNYSFYTVYVTLDHKTSLMGAFFEIKIYT